MGIDIVERPGSVVTFKIYDRDELPGYIAG